MVEVVGWMSDAQKVAMVPKMSDVARDGRWRQADVRQIEEPKVTDRRNVLGSFEEISIISRKNKTRTTTNAFV